MLLNDQENSSAKDHLDLAAAPLPRSARDVSGAKAPSASKSAAAEIKVAKVGSDPFEKLLDECDALADGRSLFALADEALFPGVEKANKIYNEIKNDDAKHQRAIDRLMKLRDFERSPSLKKAAYNAVCYSCHPQGPEEWALCSDWANVLKLADIEQVAATDFPTWLKSQKIGAAKRKVRAVKHGKAATAPVKKLKLPFDAALFPVLTKAVAEKDEVLLALLKEELLKTDQTLTGVNSVAA